MHAPPPKAKAKAKPAPKGRQWLCEVACPGPVDRPHPANYDSTKLYWSRWKHARRCIDDNRWNGKIKCDSDFTEEQAEGLRLEKLTLCWAIVARKNCPRVFHKKPVLAFFILWLAAGLGGELEFCPLSPQRRKETDEYGTGWAPFYSHSLTPLDENEERRLAKLAKAGDVIAGNMLIAAHIGIVKEIAREFRKFRGAEFDDLVQEGVFGLMKALRGFDPEMGYRFETFARLPVEQSIQDYMRELRRQQRHDSADTLEDAGMGQAIRATSASIIGCWTRQLGKI
jgi:hypothetical protein